MEMVEFDGVGVVWVSRMRLQTSTGVALVNLQDVESVNIEDLDAVDDDARDEDPEQEQPELQPDDSCSHGELGAGYSLNVCLKSGKEYEVLLPSREAADRLLDEISRHLGF